MQVTGEKVYKKGTCRQEETEGTGKGRKVKTGLKGQETAGQDFIDQKPIMIHTDIYCYSFWLAFGHI